MARQFVARRGQLLGGVDGVVVGWSGVEVSAMDLGLVSCYVIILVEQRWGWYDFDVCDIIWFLTSKCYRTVNCDLVLNGRMQRRTLHKLAQRVGCLFVNVWKFFFHCICRAKFTIFLNMWNPNHVNPHISINIWKQCILFFICCIFGCYNFVSIKSRKWYLSSGPSQSRSK